MSTEQNKTTHLPDWAVAEVESLNETIRRQKERDAIAREFGFNPHTMASEIQRLRQGATSKAAPIERLVPRWRNVDRMEFDG